MAYGRLPYMSIKPLVNISRFLQCIIIHEYEYMLIWTGLKDDYAYNCTCSLQSTLNLFTSVAFWQSHSTIPTPCDRCKANLIAVFHRDAKMKINQPLNVWINICSRWYWLVLNGYMQYNRSLLSTLNITDIAQWKRVDL